jgi:hypothetical protein
MTKPETGYSDALDALITISPAVKGCCYSVTLSGTDLRWEVSVQGPEGPGLRRLVRHLGAHERIDLAHQTDRSTYRIWTGVVGRVPVRVVAETIIIKRFSGRV